MMNSKKSSTSAPSRSKSCGPGVPPSKSASKPNSRTSSKSMDSQTSLASVGIGPSTRRPQVDFRFRLKPESSEVVASPEARTYDCIAFVITCERHKTIALTGTSEHRQFSWLPFVPLQDTFTWRRISRDGLEIILGKKDPTAKDEDVDPETDPMPPMLPEHTHAWRDTFRVQMPRKKFYLRMTQCVKLEGNDDRSKCCENVPGSRIRWIKVEDIAQGVQGDLWGHEVVAICRNRLGNVKSAFLAEMSLKCCHPSEESPEAALLRQLGWSNDKVQELFADFAVHLFPAFQMTLPSFRCFILKNALLDGDDARIKRLFSVMSFNKEFLTFAHFLAGVISMDPKASNNSSVRAKIIFRFFDIENSGSLGVVQLANLFFCLTPKQNRKEVEATADTFLKSLGTTHVDLAHFSAALNIKNSVHIPDAERLLRWSKSYFEDSSKTPAALKKKEASKSSSKQSSRGSSKSNSRKSKGQSKKSLSEKAALCSFHKPKSQYHYARHAVTLDTTNRCVDPRIISENWVHQWAPSEMTRDRYSVEHIFHNHSVANTFYSLVHDLKSQIRQANNDCRGLLTAEDDQETLAQYMELLCQQVKAILRREPKILRLAGPILIFGDTQGNLSDLFAHESRFFRSAPTIPQVLLFLGNYSGPWSGSGKDYGIECIIYLLSLKILMPNQVYLLRGRYELRAITETQLKKELFDKYGSNFGQKILSLVNDVFDRLPVAAIVEESILCTHSGIPQLAPGKGLLATVESEFTGDKFEALRNPEQTMPIAYEMISNMPTSFAQAEEFLEERPIFHPSFVKAKQGNFCYFNREAFDSFMGKNRLDLLIRSHNPTQDGYSLTFANRCLTVFSSSRCNNQPVASSVVQLDQGKARIVLFSQTDHN